uniref:Nudix hydrolase domain-containing protein n=1 Tax=Macrostomum lignano TaxID=282301 RepID=A0A1I8IWF4_9PLAT
FKVKTAALCRLPRYLSSHHAFALRIPGMKNFRYPTVLLFCSDPETVVLIQGLWVLIQGMAAFTTCPSKCICDDIFARTLISDEPCALLRFTCENGQAARATNRRLASSATTKAAAAAAAPVGELGVAISGSSPPPDRPTTTAAAAAAVVGKQPNPGNSNSSIMPQPDYLVALHLTTCGKQGEEIGTDEAPICLIAYLIHDVRHNKIIAVEQHLVKPQVNPGQTGSDSSEEDGLATISEECRSETGLSADSFHSASYLESVLEEMDKFLRNKGIHPESGGKTFTLVLEGQHPMRLVFHPETCSKKISLEQFPYFYSFFDLRKDKRSKIDPSNSP